jgi:hypothetical protein
MRRTLAERIRTSLRIGQRTAAACEARSTARARATYPAALRQRRGIGTWAEARTEHHDKPPSFDAWNLAIRRPQA